MRTDLWTKCWWVWMPSEPELQKYQYQGVHASLKTWKSWKCPGICPGIYHFQSFVLEMSWNFFATVHHFLVIISMSSQHPEKFGIFFTIPNPIWQFDLGFFVPLGPYLQYVNIWVFATSKGEKLLLVYHKMCFMSWFIYLIHSILYVDFPQVMFSSIDCNLFM